MLSTTYNSKATYQEMMASYLSGRSTALALARGVFRLRDGDLSKEKERTAPFRHVDEDRWEELFTELFNACNDLDRHPKSLEKATPYIIDEPTFRERISVLLERFVLF